MSERQTEEEFWKAWVTDLKNELDAFKKLAKKRGELNVKLGLQLEKLVALEKEQSTDEKKGWVCTACGKSTYEVEYDYLTSKTMHLECALKEEMSADD